MVGNEIECKKCGYLRIFFDETSFIKWNALHSQNCGGELKRATVAKEMNDIPVYESKESSSVPANIRKTLKEFKA